MVKNVRQILNEMDDHHCRFLGLGHVNLSSTCMQKRMSCMGEDRLLYTDAHTA